MKTFTFKNGDGMPAIGLGTWKSDPGQVYHAVMEAVKAGYRHIDCAAIYGNEAEIGQALERIMADRILPREDLWITSKLWNNAHRREDVFPALKKSLKDLRLEYLDLYLVHWPVALKPEVRYPGKAEDFVSLDDLPIIETWRAMEEALEQGLVRHIGVSNFSIKKLEALLRQASILPEMDQVELHPYLQQNDLLAFCESRGVHLTAYSPLGSRDRPARLVKEGEPIILEAPVITRIAGKHNCTPAQVLISWAVHRGTAAIPKSANPARIRENLAAGDLALDEDDMAAIAKLDRHYRYIDGSTWAANNDLYSLSELWDE